MLGKRSFIILGSALVAALAVPTGFTAEASAASSQANTAAAAPSALRDPCDGKGAGCAKGHSDGYADGRRCLQADPAARDTGQADYSYGYHIGYREGWDASQCGQKGKPAEPGKAERKAAERAAGEAQGESDADDFGKCKKSSLKGESKAFKRGYRDANPFC